MKIDDLASYKTILKIAIPAILGFISSFLFETTDLFWIGKISASAVAAAGAASFLQWTTYSFMNLTRTGCLSLMAKEIGAGDYEGAQRVGKESIHASLLVSAAIVLILLLAQKYLFIFMGLEGNTLDHALRYFTVLIWGMPVVYLFTLLGDVFNAYGDTKTSSAILLVAIAINLILDPIMIFGYFNFPEMGIAGASFATVISQVIGLILRFYVIHKKKYLNFSYIFKNPTKDFLKRIIDIGLPSATTNAIWSSVFPFLAAIITQFGMLPLAGINVGTRVEAFCYYVSLGFSIAVTTLVGQNYGKKDVKNILVVVYRCLILITLFLAPISAILIIRPDLFASLVNQDAGIIFHASNYLRIIGYLEIFLGYEMVFEGAFNGLSNGKPYMLIRIPLTIIRIPLGYFLAHQMNMGVDGVWWAISLSTFLKGSLLAYAFFTNKKNKEIFNMENQT